MNNDHKNLKSEVGKVQAVTYAVAIMMHVGSGILTGGSIFLYLSDQSDNFVKALMLSILVALMTIGALVTFTSAAVKILPRLSARYQMISFLMALFALVVVLTVSGTSNGTFLGYQEATSLEREQVISKAEAAFSSAQNSIRKLEQIVPIIRTGKQTAKRLKEFEVTSGPTGAGKGPIYQELLIQETRMAGTESGIENVISNAEQKIRSGRKILASIREAQKDYALSRAERRRILENGLSRLGSIVIELRQQMPISSLNGAAEMLRTPITLSNYSTDPHKRQIQDDTILRMHKEFKPIGISLSEAVTELTERLPGEVPTYRRMSPTAVVFAHANELFWVLAVGYALDILPYMAIGMILLAHKQLDQDRRYPSRPDHHSRSSNRPNYRRPKSNRSRGG